MKFLERANNLAVQGEIDKGLDVLYTGINKMIWEAKFDQLNDMLAGADTDKLDLNILLGILTCTLRFHLPPGMALIARPDFYGRARQSIYASDVEDKDKLLAGLEI